MIDDFQKLVDEYSKTVYNKAIDDFVKQLMNTIINMVTMILPKML